jgi:hypothetical protein
MMIFRQFNLDRDSCRRGFEGWAELCLAEIEKYRDCEFLTARFKGVTYCDGNLDAGMPQEMISTHFECGRTDSERYGEVIKDPDK